MLALTLTLTILAAPPRGFAAAHSVELVTQVDKRLSKWLTGEGDRKALLATPKELEAHLLATGAKPAEVKAQVAAAVAEQGAKAELQQFTASRALIEYDGKTSTLNFFDEGGHRCVVSLFAVGTEAAQRYVLLGAPRTDSRPLPEVLQAVRAKGHLVYAEKADGAWSTGSLPKPPPPDCTTVLKTALATISAAEKDYFKQHEAYSNSISKLKVDLKALGVTSAKVSLAGHPGPDQTFTIQVGLEGGLMKIDDKGSISIVSDCPSR
jgi:hypothetical protein